jgi:hypothetical protein
MLKQLQHKRFTGLSTGRSLRNEMVSLPGSNSYVRTHSGIVPIGNPNNKHQRQGYIHT